MLDTFARLIVIVAIPAAFGLAIVGDAVLGLLFADRYDYLTPGLTLASLLVVMLPVEALFAWSLLAGGAGRVAVLGLALRLLVVIVGSGLVLVAGPDVDSAVGLLLAYLVGAAASLGIQFARIRRVHGYGLALGPLITYGLMAGALFVGIRVILAGRVSDVAILLAIGLACLPLASLGARLILAAPTRAATSLDVGH